MKPFKLVLLATIVLVSCSSTQSVPVTTTTTTPPATVTPIDYGSDCNTNTLVEIDRLGDGVRISLGKWEADKDKSYDIALEAHTAYMNASLTLRSYIRTLDIPFVNYEQWNYVEIIKDFVDASREYWESGRNNLSVNDYLIPLDDAATDFYNAMWDICDRANEP